MGIFCLTYLVYDIVYYYFMCFMIFEYWKGNLYNQYIQISLLEFMTSVNGFFTWPMSKVSVSSLMSLCNIWLCASSITRFGLLNFGWNKKTQAMQHNRGSLLYAWKDLMIIEFVYRKKNLGKAFLFGIWALFGDH